MNNIRLLLVSCFLLICCHSINAQKVKDRETKTVFQTADPWKPETDVRADAAIVYGTSDRPGVTFEQRVQSWKNKGYQTQFMTGVAWEITRTIFLENGMGLMTI